MKIFPKITLIFIFLFLIGISVAEELVTANALKNLKNSCLMIEDVLASEDDLRTSKICTLTDNLAYSWETDEINMCYLVNHKSIQEVGAEITKMKSYIPENNFEEYRVSLELIKFYSKSYLHFMGANFHNVL